LEVRILDAETNEWTVTHPLRTVYYSFISAVTYLANKFNLTINQSINQSVYLSLSFISAVIFFLPIVTMTVAYALIIWKLWSSKRPGEALGPELKTYDNVKKRVSVHIIHTTCVH